MLPEIVDEVNIEAIIDNERTSDLGIGKSFLFDFGKSDFVIKDGKLIVIKDTDALKVWIEKILKTERFKFEIYNVTEDQVQNTEYGVTLIDLLIGHDYPISFVESEIKREITEALQRHPLIQRLEDWEIKKDNPLISVGFKVILINGNILEQEVKLSE